MRGTSRLLLVAASAALVSSCASQKIAVRPVSRGPATAGVSGSDLDKAKALYRQAEYGLALDAFRRVIRDNPDSVEAFNGMAAAYDMLGRFDLSRQYYELALARAPLDGRIYRNMALSLRMQHREGEAEALMAEWHALEQKAALAAADTPPSTGVPAVNEEQKAPPVAVAQVSPPAALPASSSVPPPAPTVRGASVTIPLDPPRPEIVAAVRAVRLMNADGRRGVARGIRTYLAGNGWKDLEVGDWNRRAGLSCIVYPTDARSQALALQARLPFATRLSVNDRASRVIVLLGRNAGDYHLQSANRTS